MMQIKNIFSLGNDSDSAAASNVASSDIARIELGKSPKERFADIASDQSLEADSAVNESRVFQLDEPITFYETFSSDQLSLAGVICSVSASAEDYECEALPHSASELLEKESGFAEHHNSAHTQRNIHHDDLDPTGFHMYSGVYTSDALDEDLNQLGENQSVERISLLKTVINLWTGNVGMCLSL
jgi:hypothetical protein